jgi:hypothetical protein
MPRCLVSDCRKQNGQFDSHFVRCIGLYKGGGTLNAVVYSGFCFSLPSDLIKRDPETQEAYLLKLHHPWLKTFILIELSAEFSVSVK